MTETYDGGCACGAVRYRLTSAPMFVHCCHCTECRRRSGAAFEVNAPIETDRVHLLKGQPTPWPIPTGSGRPQPTLRCPTCGIALWSHHPDLGPKIALVAIGTLDDPSAFPPQMHCWVRSRLPWVVLPEGVPVAEGHYEPDGVWPAESLRRLRVALTSGQ